MTYPHLLAGWPGDKAGALWKVGGLSPAGEKLLHPPQTGAHAPLTMKSEPLLQALEVQVRVNLGSRGFEVHHSNVSIFWVTYYPVAARALTLA